MVGQADQGKPKPDLMASSSESSIKKLEIEMRKKNLENCMNAKPRNSSQKGAMFMSSCSILGERASSARRRDDPMSLYFKSPFKNSLVNANDDRSALNESRSLLARMKDEFRSSTNNSLLGIHQRESLVHNHSNEKTTIKSIMIKPRVSLLDVPLEQKKISLDDLKSEFYNKLAKQRKDMGRGGTLENLFTILNKESRLSKESRDNTTLVSKSRLGDHFSLSGLKTKSREKRTSVNDETPPQVNEVKSFQEDSIVFPSNKITELIKALEGLKPCRITPTERNDLVLLRAQIKKLIN